MIKHRIDLASRQSRNYWIALIIAVSTLHSIDAFAVTLSCNLPFSRGPFAIWPEDNPTYVISAGNGWTITPDTYYRQDKNGIEYTISRHTGVLTKVEHHAQGTLTRTGTCNPAGNQ